jgi:hypothetical protein
LQTRKPPFSATSRGYVDIALALRGEGRQKLCRSSSGDVELVEDTLKDAVVGAVAGGGAAAMRRALSPLLTTLEGAILTSNHSESDECRPE